ncbi:MAG: DNA repair protein RadA, partial [Fusobacteriaceae bacterium]
MAKNKSFYICNECGYKAPKWIGKCPECGEWGSFEEEIEIPAGAVNVNKKISGSKESSKKVFAFEDITVEENFRYKTE